MQVHIRTDLRRLDELGLNASAPPGQLLYLQVTTSNLAARALYAGLGFDERYQYWYRGPGKP